MSVKISIIYYSLYGSTYFLAREIEKGAFDEGAEVRLRRVQETIPEEIWKNLKGVPEAKEMQKDVPIATIDDLVWADGIVLGSPTRFGNMAGQMKNFLDQTGSLWAKGLLYGKPISFFTGASTMHGGHETTILTMSTFAFHHGMIIVPLGYPNDYVGKTRSGGGPYGPSHNGNSRDLTDEEREIAREMGKRIVQVAKKLKD